MELSDLIINDDWRLLKDTLYIKKIVHIPICFKEDDVFYIYLDFKLKKQIFKLIKILSQNNIEFYFTTTEYSNPKEEIDNNKVINAYLNSFTKKDFLEGFDNINFDIVNNLIQWLDKEDCYYLLLDNYNRISNKIDSHWYDYYTKTNVYRYDITVREFFGSLMRDIQINRLLL